MMEKEIEKKIEKIERGIEFSLEFMVNKILKVDEYREKIEKSAKELTKEECDYYFDEYPKVYDQMMIGDFDYVSFEEGIDEITCEKFVIYPKLDRILIRTRNIDLILILNIKEIKVKKVDEE